MRPLLIAIALLMVVGCVGLKTHLGIADRPEMMSKWQAMDRDVSLLDDINRWGNWYSKDTSKNHGQCSEQADVKESVLTELGFPFRRMHCTITREWGRPFGHAFLIAQLNGKDYIMDNGAVQDIVWEYESAIKSTWGISEIKEW
jgi:predicted transglutaminase-like cysteine proteinase